MQQIIWSRRYNLFLLITRTKIIVLATLLLSLASRQSHAQSNASSIHEFYNRSNSIQDRLQYLTKINWSDIKLSKDSIRDMLSEGIRMARQNKRIDLEIKFAFSSYELVKEVSLQDSSVLLNYIQQATENKLDSLRIGGYLWLARMYEANNRFQQGDEVLTRLIENKEYQLSKYPRYQSKVYAEKGILYEQMQEHEKAIRMHVESLHLNERRKDTFMACSDLINIARNYLYLNNEKEFRNYNSKALQWAKSCGSKPFEIKAYIVFANLYGSKGQFDSCILYAMNAEKLAKEIHSEQFELETNDIIAACYMSLKNPQRALPYQLRAFELTKLDYMKSPMALNVGLCYIDLGNYALAEKYYKLALNLSAQLSERAKANTWNHLGFLAIKQKKIGQAEKNFLSAHHLSKQEDDHSVAIETNRGLAITYQLLGESEKSNNLIAKVLPVVNDLKAKLELYECQAKNFITLHQYEQACAAYQSVMVYRDSIANQNDKELTESVLAKYSVDKAEGIARLALLEKENADLNVAKQKRMKQFGFILFGLSLALLLLSAYAYGKNKKAKNKIAHQNELLNLLVEEKEMLMREIHHRVKNNLQVISGLLQLQSNATGNEELKQNLGQSQKRITSIAAIHELLYANHHVQFVDMQAYFEKILEQTIQIHDEHIQYTIDTQYIKLEMDKAIPLGLTLNEMVTNSFKHAFQGKVSGVISVVLHASDKQPFLYCLRYRDNGNVSFTNQAKNQSLGVRIIHMMTEQLHGELSFTFDHGAHYALYF